MAYSPSLTDIPSSYYGNGSSSTMGFQPSLKDIPSSYYQTSNAPGKVNTFLGTLPQPTRDPRDMMAKMGIMGVPRSPQEQQQQQQNYHDIVSGAAQSLANTPIEIANLFKKEPYQKFNFAPQTPPAQIGQMIGDIGSFFLPGGAAKLGIKALEAAPMIGKGVSAITNAIRESPILSGLGKIGTTAGEAGIYGAREDPNNALQSGLQAAGTGGGVQAASNFLLSQNPILRTLAKLGVGAGLGYSVGHPFYGMAAASSIGPVARAIGLIGGKNEVANQLLEGLNYKDVSRANAAARRLGTPLTPAQASGNYVTSGLEGAAKRSYPGAAQLGYRLESNQARQQQNAISSMLNKIYVPTPENEARINALYRQANMYTLSDPVITEMKNNPIIKSAFDTVSSDSAFKNIPQGNYEFLSEVNTQLARDYRDAVDSHSRSARRILNNKNAFNDFLKTTNPYYDQALQAAQPKMVRQGIENSFNRLQEDMTGRDFYNKFLKLKQPYQDLLRNTKNFQDAQSDIKDMRQAWKNLSNIETVSKAEAKGKSGLDQARDYWKSSLEHMNKLANNKKGVQTLKLAYSPDWDNQFERIVQQKNQSERNRNLANLMGKIGLAWGLDKNF